MAWNDPTRTVIAGTGQVYVADVGTTLPTNADTALPAADWTGLGFHSEDGVTTNQDVSVFEARSWQSRYPVRRVRETEDFTISFQLEQWDENTTPLAFGGGQIIDLGGGQWRYSPSLPGDDLDERAMVCDVDDGNRRLRFVIPRGNVTEAVESQFGRSALAMLPVTFKALEPEDGGNPWYFLTNDDDAYAPGS